LKRPGASQRLGPTTHGGEAGVPRRFWGICIVTIVVYGIIMVLFINISIIIIFIIIIMIMTIVVVIPIMIPLHWLLVVIRDVATVVFPHSRGPIPSSWFQHLVSDVNFSNSSKVNIENHMVNHLLSIV
jgi:hypothetical protein